MPTQPKPITEGWAMPGRANRFHYFQNVTSLCSAWMFTGPLDQDDGTERSDDCKKCRRILASMKKEKP